MYRGYDVNIEVKLFKCLSRYVLSSEFDISVKWTTTLKVLINDWLVIDILIFENYKLFLPTTMNYPVATNTRQCIYFVTYYILYYLNENTYINVKRYERYVSKILRVVNMCMYIYIWIS